MSDNDKNNFDCETEALLESIAKEEGLSDYKIKKIHGSIKGDGYMGDITAVQITGKSGLGKKKNLNLVVKTALKSDALRAEAPVSNIFQREIYMYNVVFPTFSKFQVEKGLPQFSNSAKCYKVCTIDKSETLILENLKELGYSMWERRIPMEDDHVKFAITEYGRFHALSFALRNQNPEVYEKLTAPMDDIIDRYLDKADFTKMFSNQCIKAVDSLDPKTDMEAIKRFEDFIEEIAPFFKGLSKLADNYSVILHADCWTNNMMFKYEDNDDPKKPTRMCLLDFQISRLGYPVFDLSHYFYACASKNVIDNWDHYLDVYYESLSGYLKELGTNSADVYPYSVFRQHWKQYSRFGLIFSMVVIHVMLTKQNEAADLSDVAESGKSVTEAFDYNISSMDEYNDRVRHIILHFVKNNFI